MMRLRRLDLTRFGHFTDKDIEFGTKVEGKADFHVIYGPNESGKTTLMEAYLRLVYGFPIQEDYAFKHAATNLQVGGIVEIDSVSEELVRVKKRQNSLRRPSGDPLPDHFFNSALGGVGLDEYRKLFCLDDRTIEEGGEEITNSKGDFGKLLFAAAAGITDLSTILEHLDKRAQDFYKKGGSKTKYAELKRQFDTVTSEIRDRDTSASAYRSLMSALDTARGREQRARADKDKHAKRKLQLSNLISAFGISTELRNLESELDPVAHYPQTLDINPEMLVSMISERVSLTAELARLQTAIIAKKDKLAAIVLKPEIIALAETIRSLEAKSSRMKGALEDLPGREDERRRLLDQIAEKLGYLGFGSVSDPLSAMPSDFELEKLEKAARALENAESEARQAIERRDQAKQALDDSKRDAPLESVEEKSLTNLEEMLERLDAPQWISKITTADAQIAAAEDAAGKALRALARGLTQFETVPTPPFSLGQISDVVQRLDVLDAKISNAEGAKAEAGLRNKKLKAKLESLARADDLVTDERAAKSRSDRNELWDAHKTELSAASASTFELSMNSDDRVSDLRRSHAQRLADYEAAKTAQSESEVDLEHETSGLNGLKDNRLHLEERRKQYLVACHLPDLTGMEVIQWAQLQQVAESAGKNLEQIRIQNQPLQAKAKELRQKLSTLVTNPAGLDLAGLLGAGQRQVALDRVKEEGLKARRENTRRLTDDLAARERDVSKADNSVTEHLGKWQAQLTASLSNPTRPARVQEVLPDLRKLLIDVEKVNGFSRQITGMKRDQEDFTAEAIPLAYALKISPDLPAFEIFNLALEELKTAEAAKNRYAEIEKELADEQKADDDAKDKMDLQDHQIQELAAIFDPAIDTKTPQALRTAVIAGHSAIGLGRKLKTKLDELLQKLGVSTRQGAEVLLNASTLDEATIELDDLLISEAATARAVEDAIEERSRCETQVSNVGGDSEIAGLVSKRRTLELEMETGVLGYLEDRFSYLLADRALRRYRDSHRSGMLSDTEAAFRTLTAGAYASLTTQYDGKSEILMAIAKADGSSKKTSEMSKGTKYQLYLALRAAAYRQIATSGTIVPFFCGRHFRNFRRKPYDRGLRE